jgi:RNA recognition motif-containing protein
MVRTKVFVGNLDFKTKESELAKEFSVAGKVISANIITRGPRSLGYGFVEMESEEDANKAVQLLNKKEIDGRPINVEVAKPREELQEQKQQQQQQTGGEQATNRGGRGGARGGRGRGGRGGARGSRGGRGNGRGGRGGARPPKVAPGTGANAQAQPQQQQQQQPQQQQQKKEDRTPSKTTLFVANLPFAVDDDAFGKILKDSNLAFKMAKVVRNARSKRSKGFGFIEFDNEADQQKALAALNNKQVEGRELAVKVALTELKTEETQTQTQAQTQTKA